jgi:hypothetical protein
VVPIGDRASSATTIVEFHDLEYSEAFVRAAQGLRLGATFQIPIDLTVRSVAEGSGPDTVYTGFDLGVALPVELELLSISGDRLMKSNHRRGRERVFSDIAFRNGHRTQVALNCRLRLPLRTEVTWAGLRLSSEHWGVDDLRMYHLPMHQPR